jgi:sugar-specific transcriptional regulator TrmB
MILLRFHNFLSFFFFCLVLKIKNWLRENRSGRNKRVAKIIEKYYELRLQSLKDVEAELRFIRSNTPEDGLASAMTVSAIATTFWDSARRSEAEYTWIRRRVSDVENCLVRAFTIWFRFSQTVPFSISDGCFSREQNQNLPLSPRCRVRRRRYQRQRVTNFYK